MKVLAVVLVLFPAAAVGQSISASILNETCILFRVYLKTPEVLVPELRSFFSDYLSGVRIDSVSKADLSREFAAQCTARPNRSTLNVMRDALATTAKAD